MKKSLLAKLAETYLAHQAEAQAEPGRPPPVRGNHFVRWLPNVLVSAFVSIAAIGGTAVARPGLFAPAPSAASNNTFAYQGRIANAAGAPLTGVFPMSFRLYSQAIAGVPLWSEDWTASNSVRVNDGLFSVMLGSLVAIPNTIAANNSLWLGVSVGGDSEMSPRVQLGAVPFSMQALTVPDGSITPAKLASPLPRLLGHSTCNHCGEFTESVTPWFPVHGANASQSIAVTATVTGRPLLISMVGAYAATGGAYEMCGVAIDNASGQRVQLLQLSGIQAGMTGDGHFVCTGSVVFPDLPAGTYRFSAWMFNGAATSILWVDFRQIAVFEF